MDIEDLEKFKSYIPSILDLRKDIQSTLKEGGRIYLCGCGATGRLSLLLERLWRKLVPGDENVRAFMAGGDVALVHSLESFEDFPEYGARHLEQLGFTENDLLISSTEGGETPYVIGATEFAAKNNNASRAPPDIAAKTQSLLFVLIETNEAWAVSITPKISKTKVPPT